MSISQRTIDHISKRLGIRLYESDYGVLECSITSYTQIHIDSDGKYAWIQTQSRKGMAPEIVHSINIPQESRALACVLELIAWHKKQLLSDAQELQKMLEKQ